MLRRNQIKCVPARADDWIEPLESLERRMNAARENMRGAAIKVAISSKYPSDDWARFHRVEPADLKFLPFRGE